MSKLSDYSKFDHIVDSDDSEDEQQPPIPVARPASSSPPIIASLPQQQQQQQQEQQTISSSTSSPTAPNSAATTTTTRFIRHPRIPTRFILQHAGRSIYEWEQSLDAIVLYIPTPPGVTSAHQLRCEIKPHRLQVGLRPPTSTTTSNTNSTNNNSQQQWFLDEPTGGTVDVASSTWTWEPSVLTVDLQKANKGVVWETVCQGTTHNIKLDPLQLEEERQRCMLERWQEENPGMDFRNATFNGSAPDPRTFMGGVRYD